MTQRTRAAVAGAALMSIASWMAYAGAPGTWTKISTGKPGNTQSALLRTPDSKLHVVWPTVTNKKQAYGHTAVTASGAASRATMVLTGWDALHPQPRLVPNGSGLRLIFSGLRGASGDPYSTGAMYTATSSTGTGWTLEPGSLSKSGFAYASVGTGATAELDGTPVACWSWGGGNTLYWHAGVDPSVPAKTTDHTFNSGKCCNQLSALATDSVSGAVWIAWYSSESGANDGYFARPILPTLGTKKKAPRCTVNGDSIIPWQEVALSGRSGAGGVYLAYKQGYPSITRVALWKLGTSTVLTVPDSADAIRVALTAGPDGRLWVTWCDGPSIHVVLTDKNVSTFSAVTTISPPANTADVYGIACEGSRERLDIVINALSWNGDYGFWHTQVLPDQAP